MWQFSRCTAVCQRTAQAQITAFPFGHPRNHVALRWSVALAQRLGPVPGSPFASLCRPGVAEKVNNRKRVAPTLVPSSAVAPHGPMSVVVWLLPRLHMAPTSGRGIIANDLAAVFGFWGGPPDQCAWVDVICG